MLIFIFTQAYQSVDAYHIHIPTLWQEFLYNLYNRRNEMFCQNILTEFI